MAKAWKVMNAWVRPCRLGARSTIHALRLSVRRAPWATTSLGCSYLTPANARHARQIRGRGCDCRRNRQWRVAGGKLDSDGGVAVDGGGKDGSRARGQSGFCARSGSAQRDDQASQKCDAVMSPASSCLRRWI
ncbi:hypothetical protein ANO11243_023220 [Dothideomycetidae sp. 11243]|nr:hypothetical protein ANO11243_023220 [fungal sp. No.11243]